MRQQEKGVDPNAWMVTFSDLLTLLLTFFVLLISMSSLDNKKLKKAMSFFLEAAGPLELGRSGGIGRIYVVPPMTDLVGGFKELEKFTSNKVKPSLQEEFWKKRPSSGGVYVLPPGSLVKEAWMDVKKFQAVRRPSLREEALGRGMDVEAREEEILLRMPSRLLFSSGSARIHQDGLDLLMWLAGRLRDTPYWIEVEGHTDNRPISTARFPSNWELSLARAVNVVRFLQEKGGIEGRRLSAAGYADLRPLFPNDTPDGRRKNRRVEILLKKMPSAEESWKAFLQDESGG